jgi:hypothetical protein
MHMLLLSIRKRPQLLLMWTLLSGRLAGVAVWLCLSR